MSALRRTVRRDDTRLLFVYHSLSTSMQMVIQLLRELLLIMLLVSFIDGQFVNKDVSFDEALSRRNVSVDFDKICYSAGVKNLAVKMADVDLECGERIPKKLLIDSRNNTPEIDFNQTEVDKRKLFTLMLVDPDMPTHLNPRCRSWIYWLVTDIQDGNMTTGRNIVPYLTPMPSVNTGDHHYSFLLFQQTNDEMNPERPATRCQFSVTRFMDDNALHGPVARNMFRSENKVT